MTFNCLSKDTPPSRPKKAQEYAVKVFSFIWSEKTLHCVQQQVMSISHASYSNNVVKLKFERKCTTIWHDLRPNIL